MSRYFLVLILSFVIPFFVSFWPPLRFYHHIRALCKTILIVTIIFGGWDIFATYRGHWYFNPKYVWNFRFFKLPLEEWLFFIIIPFCCIFTWEAIKFINTKK